MDDIVCPPQYLQIALDIASRIARGEFKEGTKIYGRSVMASEYGVSPETIRRALKLLADMQVVEIKEKSGVIISSTEKSRKYIERFGERSNVKALQAQLKAIIAEHNVLTGKMVTITSAIARLEEKSAPVIPFNNYEVRVEPNCEFVGKNIGELCFWQATGATVIAIRRGKNIILSPGPYAQLLAHDTVVFVGDAAAVRAVTRFLGGE
ncbi:MAG: TrkA C-terminal domain-containing protein [Angelakisella sp.]